MYFSIVSAPGHFCIAALYKYSMYCIVLYCIAGDANVCLGSIGSLDFHLLIVV